MKKRQKKYEEESIRNYFILYICACIAASVIFSVTIHIINKFTENVFVDASPVVEDIVIQENYVAETLLVQETTATEPVFVTEHTFYQEDYVIETHHSDDFSNTPIEKNESDPQKGSHFVTLDGVDEVIEPKDEVRELICNQQDNLSNWFIANDNTSTSLILWKKNDKNGNLLLALRDSNNVTLATFVYDTKQYDWISTECNEWEVCETYYSYITAQNVIDVTFTTYHEVSGRVPSDVQFQTMVLFNRDKSLDFNDTLRGVITQKNQYSCKNSVINRRLKSNSMAEKEDLEKCFRAVLLSFADELIEPVPEDVVWAARFPQGSGIWQKSNGTYYCHR